MHLSMMMKTYQEVMDFPAVRLVASLKFGSFDSMLNMKGRRIEFSGHVCVGVTIPLTV